MEPHFHVTKSGEKWDVRVYFLTCTEGFLHMEYKRPRNPPANFDAISRAKRRELLELVLKHQAELFGEWQRKVRIAENYDADS